MMQSANNGHMHPHAHHPPPPPPHHPHLDPRYMDYAAMSQPHHPHHHPHAAAHHHAAAAAAAAVHLDPHALHYASLSPLAPTPQQPQPGQVGHSKRNADSAGLESYGGGGSSDEDGSMDVKPPVGSAASASERGAGGRGQGQPKGSSGSASDVPAGKKTKGRVKIKMEFIDNKLRRYTTFSKRKTGIMKKAYELSTLTGTQVMLLVASETGHVYTFATRKLQPMITSDAGKALIQTCLNSPDPPPATSDQRMSATGYEETELTYNIADDEQQKVRQMMYNSHYSAAAAVSSSLAAHNLFPPSSAASVAAAPPPPVSAYSAYPAPSPSPSHYGGGGVSVSPGPGSGGGGTNNNNSHQHLSSSGSSHSPPFQHSSSSR